MRVRFTVDDSPNNSLLEALVDDFWVASLECEDVVPPCPWDFDDNGFVGPVDAGMVKNHLGCDVNDPECAPYDLDGNGFVGPVDVGEVKNNFGPCPE